MPNQIIQDKGFCHIKNVIFCTYIVLMSVQLVAIEGFSVSPLKVATMLLSPFFIMYFKYHRILTDATFWGIANLILMTASASFASPIVAWDRIGYRSMYVFMFILVYCIMYEGCIKLSMIKRLLVVLMVAYGVIFLIQHALYLVGIRTQIFFLNYYASVTMNGVFKPNGLSCEPSHAARIITVIYWGILKLSEIELGKKINIKYAFKEMPYCSSLFFISMIAMGSATGMIGILLILLYFFSKNFVVFFIGFVFFILMMNMEIENMQIRRIQNVFNSFFSDDVSETLKKSEGSGAVRIMPFINTFSMDFFSVSTWIGQGSVSETNFLKKVFSESRYLGDITSFGLISYLTSLLFVYKCCIRKFLSMETLIFLLLATFSVGSVYYTWLMLMIFMIVKYFGEHKTQIIKTGSINTHEK